MPHVPDLLGVCRGKQVHRLDLMLIDPGSHGRDALDQLACVFSCLPNLEILNVCTTSSQISFVPRSAMCAIRDTCRSSLKQLSWDPSSSLRPTQFDTQAMLCACSQLATLGKLCWPDCDGYSIGCPYALPVLKKLECLMLPYGHSDHCSPPPRFPALRKVILSRSVPDGCVDAFISEHAQSLRIAFIEVMDENQSLSALAKCPDLVHLVLYMAPDMVRAVSCWQIPATVSHLGVYVHSRSDTPIQRELIVLLGHLSSMEAVGLKVVRLLHLCRRDLAGFVRTDGFALVHDLFARAGWILEDRMGYLLSPI